MSGSGSIQNDVALSLNIFCDAIGWDMQKKCNFNRLYYNFSQKLPATHCGMFNTI